MLHVSGVPQYVVAFCTLVIHLWMMFHAHYEHILHHMPHSYRWHIRMLHRQVSWLFRHISGNA